VELSAERLLRWLRVRAAPAREIGDAALQALQPVKDASGNEVRQDIYISPRRQHDAGQARRRSHQQNFDRSRLRANRFAARPMEITAISRTRASRRTMTKTRCRKGRKGCSRLHGRHGRQQLYQLDSGLTEWKHISISLRLLVPSLTSPGWIASLIRSAHPKHRLRNRKRAWNRRDDQVSSSA